jgi:hypothetical protein
MIFTGGNRAFLKTTEVAENAGLRNGGQKNFEIYLEQVEQCRDEKGLRMERACCVPELPGEIASRARERRASPIKMSKNNRTCTHHVWLAQSAGKFIAL